MCGRVINSFSQILRPFVAWAALCLLLPQVVFASISLVAGETVILATSEQVSIDGSVTIAATSTLDASASGATITLTGDWTNLGTFVPGDLTIAGSGTSLISGNTTFRSFSCQSGSKTLTFAAGSTQTFVSGLTLSGQDANNRLTIRSTVPGSQYSLQLQSGHQTVSFVDVRDGNLGTSTILPLGSIDSGNNSDLWLFSIKISGQVLVGGTPLAGVLIDGGALGTKTTAADGRYSFSNVAFGTSYIMTPSLGGYTFTPASANGTINNHKTHNFTAISSGRNITGRVTLENLEQTPLAGVTVSGGGQSAVTDSAGNYQLSAVAPGAQQVTASLPGYQFTPETKQLTLSTGDAEASFTAKPVVANPAYAFWNGFLGMVNVLEIMNTGSDALNLNLTVYSIGGAGNTISKSWTVPPMTQRDIILNDLAGFEKDTYGMIKLAASHNSFDGRVSIYFPDTSGQRDSLYGFAYGEPLRNSNVGRSAVTFNSYHPGNNIWDANNSVFNWLSIGNLSASAKTFTVKRYNMVGLKVAEQDVTVPALGRRDVDGGHVNPGPNNVGTNVIIPKDNAAPYLASLARYAEGSNFDTWDYSFALPATTGAVRSVYAPISTVGIGENYVEVANMLERETSVALKFVDTEGFTLAENMMLLPAYSQRHLSTVGLLAGDVNSGYVAITPSEPNSIIAQSLFYHRENSNRSIQTAYASPAREIYGSKLYTTYNFYLGMNNLLRLMNIGSDENTLSYSLAGGEGRTLTLVGTGGFEKELFEASRRDSYGLVEITTPVPGTIAAELVRMRKLTSGKVEFAISSPAK